MNTVVKYAQKVVSMSRCSQYQYVDGDCAILGQCLAGVDGAWFIPTDVSMREYVKRPLTPSTAIGIGAGGDTGDRSPSFKSGG